MIPRTKYLKPFAIVVLLVLLIVIALLWISTIPREQLVRRNAEVETEASLDPLLLAALERQKEKAIALRRQQQIDKVTTFFQRYGSNLTQYAHIIVDKAEECGGDYRVLVGIAGSESGLGRVMYKKYNPYGYLDGVQYKSQQEALEILSCKISRQHIAPCGTDLYCLARRYAGSKDDLNNFVSKVKWFMDQVS